MIAYLLYAVIFFIVYYFVEQKILKASLIKAGKRFSELSSSVDLIKNMDLTALRKKTDYYKLKKDVMISLIYQSLN
jgi:hypothetical protein